MGIRCLTFAPAYRQWLPSASFDIMKDGEENVGPSVIWGEAWTHLRAYQGYKTNSWFGTAHL